MCKHGDTVEVELAPFSKPVEVDRCLAKLLRALNVWGFKTVRSCCGHGRWPGWIHLADGRTLIIHQTGMGAKRSYPASVHMDVAEALGGYLSFDASEGEDAGNQGSDDSA